MEIYKAIKDETITINIINNIATQSIIYINDIEFDNVYLADGFGSNSNLRILEVNLHTNDIVTINSNELIVYNVIVNQ